MTILITGAAGYIGSHTCAQLIQQGIEVVGIDDFSNSSPDVIERITEITGKNISFYKGDIKDKKILRKIFSQHQITRVIHFAGFKSVGESTKNPMKYYENNVSGTLTLLEIMNKFGVKKIIFSSSATVYGRTGNHPVSERSVLAPINPYGRTKLIAEQLLEDISCSDPSWSIVILRYFNPIGAHKTGLLGEVPNGIPNNLLPYVSQVAAGIRSKVVIFGDDYNTHDGTGVRDYIHVMDLAEGHIKALEFVEKNTGLECFNLGTGKGYSVLDVIRTFENVSGAEVKYIISERREGDADVSFADVSKAKESLNWQAKFDLDEMCRSVWVWENNNKIKQVSSHIDQAGWSAAN